MRTALCTCIFFPDSRCAAVNGASATSTYLPGPVPGSRCSPDIFFLLLFVLFHPALSRNSKIIPTLYAILSYFLSRGSVEIVRVFSILTDEATRYTGCCTRFSRRYELAPNFLNAIPGLTVRLRSIEGDEKGSMVKLHYLGDGTRRRGILVNLNAGR